MIELRQPTRAHEWETLTFAGPPAWWVDAACRGMDSRIFFPKRGESARPARLICAGCPVKSECLADALAQFSSFDDSGVRGGMTVRERIRIRNGGKPAGTREVAMLEHRNPEAAARLLALHAEGWSQARIATAVGVDPRTVGRVIARAAS